MVGGLLVAVAALGTWYVASGADRGPDTRYVVASRAIGPGERIGSADLGLVTVELPDALSSGAFTSVEELVDTVALGPIARGELIQTGGVATVGPTDGAELSFSVEAEWAVGGKLRPGDLIDLFDTDQRAGPEGTRRVLSGATILDITRPDDALGRNRTVTITVAIDDPDLLPAAVRATRTGTISVVRVTGASPSTSGAREHDGETGEQADGAEGDEEDDT